MSQALRNTFNLEVLIVTAVAAIIPAISLVYVAARGWFYRRKQQGFWGYFQAWIVCYAFLIVLRIVSHSLINAMRSS